MKMGIIDCNPYHKKRITNSTQMINEYIIKGERTVLSQQYNVNKERNNNGVRKITILQPSKEKKSKNYHWIQNRI
jgi:hypothetical protein